MTLTRGFIFYVPEDLATTPAEGHCFVNRWWSVHPEHGVAFYASNRRPQLDPGEEDEPSPQCNSDEHTARALTQRNKPDCIVKQIPAVFIRPAIREMNRLRAERRATAVGQVKNDLFEPPARPTPSALWDGKCGDDLGFIVQSRHALSGGTKMTDHKQLTFATIGGETVTVRARGKHYVQARGYADRPGTGPVGETCGSCANHVVRRLAKGYHKCALTAPCWTGGRRSDILVRSPACSKWAALTQAERS